MYTADRLRLEGRRQGLEEGIGQGIEQGEDRALRRTLLRQLRLRFRVKASSVKAMVQSAALSQVQRWLDRMVLAATLDDVFRED